MPLLYKKYHQNASLFIWEIEESEEEFKLLLPTDSYTSATEGQKLKKRKLEKLSQLCLQEIAGVKADDIHYLQNGKPSLHSKKHLSFSHSGSLSALLLTDDNCGLDLEIPSEKIIHISSKFISLNEKRFINTNEQIYWAWSIKESVFKYFGERVLFKEHIRIEKIDEESKTAFVNYEGFHGKGRFEIELLRVKNSYLAFTKRYTSS